MLADEVRLRILGIPACRIRLVKVARLRTKRMRDRDRAKFYAQLARLLESGLAPQQALTLLGEQGTSLSMGLLDGHGLARTWRKDPDFGEMEGWVVEAGEVSGELSTCLEGLAEHFERQSRYKRQMLGKLLYPVFLLHAVFLLPSIGLLLTQGLAAYFRLAVVPLVLAWVLVGAGVFLFGKIRTSPAAAFRLDQLLLRLPLLGPVLRDRALALYSGGLALLLGAGLPVLDSLDRAARMVSNRWIRRRAESVTIGVRKGSGIAESMEGSFPTVFVEMVRVGEASGRLDTQLGAASRYFDEEGQTAITRLVTITSFLSFFLVAIVVGIVVIRGWLAILGI